LAGYASSCTAQAFFSIASRTRKYSSGVVGSYAVQLSRTTEFTGYAGVIRSETKFVQSVPVDPVVAALLGQTTGNVIVHRNDYIPAGTAVSRARFALVWLTWPGAGPSLPATDSF
jgi:hypothetical protein